MPPLALTALLLAGTVHADLTDPRVVDLRVDLEITTESPIASGGPLEVEATLINTSETATYFVVPVSDGSEMGWREPHVSVAIEFRGEDGWEGLESRGIARCGLYDFEWWTQTVELRPGGATTFGPWMSQLSVQFDLARAGEYRIQLHYDYDPSAVTAPTVAPPEVGPAFQLTSDWVRFEVEGSDTAPPVNASGDERD